MNVKDILEIAAAIIASVGGCGIIILGLSKWFGGVLANKLLENEKLKYNKELEEYKSKLNEQLNKVKSISEKELYVSKAQYDNEYKIYMEIWEKLHNCTAYTLQLYPQGPVNVPADENAMLDYQKKKYKKYYEHFIDFTLTIDKYAPFYQQEFYEKFKEIKWWCSRQGEYFDHYEIQRKINISYAANRDAPIPNIVDEDMWLKIPYKIRELENELSEQMREYLLTLSLKEQ